MSGDPYFGKFETRNTATGVGTSGGVTVAGGPVRRPKG